MFGGSSSQKTSVDTSAKTATDSAFQINASGKSSARVGTSDITLGKGASLSVTQTDQGAVAGGLSLANDATARALSTTSDLAKVAFTFGNELNTKASDLSAASLKLAGKAADALATGKAAPADAGLGLPGRLSSSVDWAQLAKWAAMAVAAVAAVYGLFVYARKRKG